MTSVRNIEASAFSLLKSCKITPVDLIKIMDQNNLDEIGVRVIKGKSVKINPDNLSQIDRQNRNKIYCSYAAITHNGIPIDLNAYDKIVSDHAGELAMSMQVLNDRFPNTVILTETGVKITFKTLPKDFVAYSNGYTIPSDYCKIQHPEIAEALKYCRGWQNVKSRVKRKALLQTISQPCYTSTGRCQYSASKEFDGDLMLQPKRFRVIIDPKANLYEIDATAEDFFTTAALANDENMLDDYFSDDVYTAFIEKAGLTINRDAAKILLLGIIKGMSDRTVAKNAKITIGTARKLREMLFARYSRYRIWAERESGLLIDNTGTYQRNEQGSKLYQPDHVLSTPLGFTNTLMLNTKSFEERYNAAISFRSQAMGSVILYKTIVQAIRENLPVHATLHDAIYVSGYANALRIDQLFRESSRQFCGYEMKTKIKKVGK